MISQQLESSLSPCYVSNENMFCSMGFLVFGSPFLKILKPWWHFHFWRANWCSHFLCTIPSVCIYLFVGVCFALSFLDIISSPLEYSPKTWSWFIQHVTCEEKEGKGVGNQISKSGICGHGSKRNGYMMFILCSCKTKIAIDFCLKVFCGQLGARAYKILLIFTSSVHLSG